MDFAAGEFPDQPGFHSAEEQFTIIRLSSGTGDVFQDPVDLGAGEVGVDDQTGFVTDGVGQTL